MQVNSINSVYFGKKGKVNKNYAHSDRAFFRYSGNNKENKVSKQFKKELNLIGKSFKLNDPDSFELMKDCETNFNNKLDKILNKKVKVRKFRFGL